MGLTVDKINQITREISQATLPVINAAYDSAKGMRSARDGREYIGVHLDGQDYHVALDETQPIRTMVFSAPDDDSMIYARVDAYRDQDGAFSFKLYEGNLDFAMKEGTADQIIGDVSEIVGEGIRARNLAKRDYPRDSVTAEHESEAPFALEM